jgi:hypothetical protein
MFEARTTAEFPIARISPNQLANFTEIACAFFKNTIISMFIPPKIER